MIYLPANIYCYSTKPRSHTKGENHLVSLLVFCFVTCPFPRVSAGGGAPGARGTLLALTVHGCQRQRDVGGDEVIYLVALGIVGEGRGGEGRGGKGGEGRGEGRVRGSLMIC